MPIAALALVLLAATTVENDARFREARQMFEDFELEGALARFKLILLDGTLGDEERARVLLWQGLTEAELGRFGEAEETFKAALRHDRDAKLPALASPKVAQMLEEARARFSDEVQRRAEVATGPDGTLHPSGPGVLIKTTEAGRMEASVQEQPPESVVPPAEEGSFPLLLLSGSGAVVLGLVTVGGGGVLGGLALADHGRAIEADVAKEALAVERQAQTEALGANVMFATGSALVVAGAALALVGLLVDEGE